MRVQVRFMIAKKARSGSMKWGNVIPALLKVMCLLIIFAGLAGCAFVRGEVGAPFSEEHLQGIEKGKTTRQEVALQLGAPDEIVMANSHEIFHYRRFDSKLGWFLFLSRLNIGSDNLWVFFNQEGIVDEVIYGNRTGDLKFQFWPFGN
jgi:hypothetical protein